ncbi:MAG: tetratricopeptide repeat protein [Planctomycetes bacterium]|nr:tetratricopeptide repeat protein [Planctomycetota bacterium]
MNKLLAACAASLSLAACAAPLPDGAEARALDGRALVPPPLPDDVDVDRQAKLAEARAALQRAPDDRDAWIWVGRRLAYLGRYREAIDVYSEALQRWPDDPFLLRHRGHRWITVRAFDRAIEDLSRAAERCRVAPDEVEPDGLPVFGRPPHSSLHFNVHYHHGLARFLVGDFVGARDAWLLCLACSDDDESRVAVTHWLWCARMRCGDPAGAAASVQGITEDMDVVENTAYHQLCLLYRDERTRGQLTAGEGSSGAALRFGLAHHLLVTGERAAARQALVELAADPGWAAFGAIAAEAELQRW